MKFKLMIMCVLSLLSHINGSNIPTDRSNIPTDRSNIPTDRSNIPTNNVSNTMLPRNVTVTLKTNDNTFKDTNLYDCCQAIQDVVRTLISDIKDLREIYSVSVRQKHEMASEFSRKFLTMNRRILSIETSLFNQKIEIDKLKDLLEVYETDFVVPSIRRNLGIPEGTSFIYNNNDAT